MEALIILFALLYLAGCVVVGFNASEKGFSFAGVFLLSLLFTPASGAVYSKLAEIVQVLKNTQNGDTKSDQ